MDFVFELSPSAVAVTVIDVTLVTSDATLSKPSDDIETPVAGLDSAQLIVLLVASGGLIALDNCNDAPGAIELEAEVMSSIDEMGTEATHVIVAGNAPSTVVAVMVHVPSPT